MVETLLFTNTLLGQRAVGNLKFTTTLRRVMGSGGPSVHCHCPLQGYNVALTSGF